MQRQKYLGATSLTSRLTPEYEQRMAGEGKKTEATLLIVEQGLQRRIYYGFLTKKTNRYPGSFLFPIPASSFYPMDFRSKTAMLSRSNTCPRNPKYAGFNFPQPTNQTFSRIPPARPRSRATRPPGSLTGSKPLHNQTRDGAEKGWQRLADLIFQQYPPDKNLDHNRDSYFRLVRETEFAQSVARECWDK